MMFGSSTFVVFTLGGLASVGVAQFTGWDLKNGQINSTMCTWQSLRGEDIANFN